MKYNININAVNSIFGGTPDTSWRLLVRRIQGREIECPGSNGSLIFIRDT
jgi:hypothetical protein